MKSGGRPSARPAPSLPLQGCEASLAPPDPGTHGMLGRGHSTGAALAEA